MLRICAVKIEPTEPVNNADSRAVFFLRIRLNQNLFDKITQPFDPFFADQPKIIPLGQLANWCWSCCLLHNLFEKDQAIRELLQKSYVVVLVDVNQGRNKEVDAQYGNPTSHGFPVIVVLDADRKLLVTKDTSELAEGDHHSPEKVLEFLNEWAPKK
jgi:hypothetical protein